MHNDMVEDELEISEVCMLLIYLTFFPYSVFYVYSKVHIS